MDDKPVTKKELIEVLTEFKKGIDSRFDSVDDVKIDGMEIKTGNGFLEMSSGIDGVRSELEGVKDRLELVESNLTRRIDGIIEGKIRVERERY